MKRKRGKQKTIKGTPPDLISPPKGCAFAQRCSYCMNICLEEEPETYSFGDGHDAVCWLYHEDAPKGKLEVAVGGGHDE